MLGKFINGMLITPTKEERKKLVVINPSDEVLKCVMGYKELEIQRIPEYDENTQYAEAFYIQTEDKIIKGWKVKEKEII